MELVKSISIENLVNQRDAIVAKALEIETLLMQIDELSKCLKINAPAVLIHGYIDNGAHTNSCEFINNSDYFIKNVDARLWSLLMKESGFNDFMDSATKDKWRESISNASLVPALTKQNIYATFDEINKNKSGMLEDGIINVFKSLSYDYKTNLPVKFGSKCVVEKFFDEYKSFCSYKTTAKVDDLVRAFYILDGKRELIKDDLLSNRLFLAFKNADSFEDEYFFVKMFKNGNIHIKFKRLDLVEKMNKIISKHYPAALPCPR